MENKKKNRRNCRSGDPPLCLYILVYLMSRCQGQDSAREIEAELKDWPSPSAITWMARSRLLPGAEGKLDEQVCTSSTG